MPRESTFRKQVEDFLKGLPESFWFTIQQGAIRGTPDKLGLVNGLFVALEIKASEKAKRSKLQIYNINRINQAGGHGVFVYPENWNQVKADLYYMANGSFPHSASQ